MRLSFLFLSFFLLGSTPLFSTGQIPDRLLYQGDTLDIFSNPLEAYFEKRGSRVIPEFSGCHSTACWRGYIAWWELRKDSLFLVQITNCAYGDEPKENADLSLLFPGQAKNQSVFADWVKGPIYNPYGKRLHYEHSGYLSIYEYERVFTFRNGIWTKVKRYKNQVYNSPYITNPDSLLYFLYQNIRWDDLPPIPENGKFRVILNFKTDSLGFITEPKVLRSCGPAYEAEALRIIASLGKWSLCLRRGKVFNYYSSWNLPISFNRIHYQNKFE